MPEYSSTTITPSDGVQVPGMNGSTSGNFLLSALKSYILASKGQANGLASLDANGKLPSSQLPDLADDVIVVASYASLPATGTAGKIYITADNNKMYRWDPDLTTPDYVELSVDLSAYATKAELAAEESARETEDSRLKSAIQGNSQRIENLEVAVSGSLVQTNTDATMANTKVITNANEILPWAILKRVGARSIAWVQVGKFRETTYYNVSAPDADGYQKISLKYTETRHARCGTNGDNPLPLGHKVFAIMQSKTTGALTGSRWFIQNANDSEQFSEITSDNNTVITTTTYARSVITVNWQPFFNDNPTAEIEVKVQLFDLTANGFEALYNTDGLRKSNFVRQFPSSYYPVNTGSIIPLNPSAFKVVGFNKWDEEWEVGRINDTTGQPEPYANTIRSKNYIPVDANQEYYVQSPIFGTAPAVGDVYTYDANKNYLGIIVLNNNKFDTWTSIAFIKIRPIVSYGNVYKNDICINISQTDSTKPLHNGVYEAYTETTIDTSFTSDYKYVNESCHDYSENVLVDGQKKRKEHNKVGELNLGNNQLVWDKSEQTGFVIFYTQNGLDTLFGIKAPSSGSNVANALCDIFAIDSAVNTNNGSLALSIGADGARIRISVASSSTYGSMTKEQFASAMNGVMLYFEKATEVVTTSSDFIPNFPTEDGTTITAITPQTDLVNSIDVPSTIAYMTKIGG